MIVIKSVDNETVALAMETKQAVLIPLILQPSTRSCFFAKAQSHEQSSTLEATHN